MSERDGGGAGDRNALDGAASPYLAQHADNPVAWVPWSEAAFEEARRRDVPVLVSIGYSTCHWCHVMAHESFEDDGVAALMNARFVCVKVDREEHPEVDEIYMDAVQAMTGHGGWPLHAVCDHDGRPFFAGTYFPKDRWMAVLARLSQAWSGEREQVDQAAAQVADALRSFSGPRAVAEMPDDVWDTLTHATIQSYDRSDPGFARAPKFPPSQLLSLLLQRRDARAQAGVTMAEAILTAMQDSGLHDRVGGGFHRYSVDGQWRVPHFEKMLYDNALLIGAYARAGAQLGRPDFTRTAINAGDYLLRDMRVVDDAGTFVGYASAEDADDPGGEGSFYAWPPSAVRAALGDDDAADALIRAWDLHEGEREVGPSGHLEPVRTHIPQPRAKDLAAMAPDGDVQALRRRWEPHLPILRKVRDARPRPGRDDKVLTDLNGLALSAFALLGRFGAEGYDPAQPRLAGPDHEGDSRARFLAATRELANALRARSGDDGLARMPGRPAFITDYGHLVVGLLDAYALLGDPDLVTWAAALADEAVASLRADDGGFYTTPAGRGDLVRRSREHTDGPYPAGMHALALGFTRLGALTGDGRWGELAAGIFSVQGTIAGRAPTATPTLLTAWLERTTGPLVVVVTGRADDATTLALLDAARRSTVAGLHVVPTAGHEGVDWPILEARRELPPQALVCVGERCLLPAMTPEELAARIAEATAA